MKKAYYSLADIEKLGPLKSAGKNWTATCPQCGKKHLSISKHDGVYYCFTPDCNCSGLLTDFWKEGSPPLIPPRGEDASQLNSTKVQDWKSYKSSKSSRVLNVQECKSCDTKMIPTDYKRVKEEVMQTITIIEEGQELPEMVSRYVESIGISQEILARMKVGYTSGDLCYVNYINQRPVNVKYRSLTAKAFRQESPTTPCPPYNIDCINPLLVPEEIIDRLIIVEGEKDAMTVCQAGYPYVISIANGAATDVEKCFEAFSAWLEPIRDIVICGDSDLPGRTLQKHLIDYFGARSHAVSLPSECKDISEVMQQYGWECVRETIDNARPVFTQEIVSVASIADAVVRRLHGDYDHGYDLGYGPLTDAVFHLTDIGGLIIVTGKPNAGKTDFLNDICAHMLYKCGKNVAMCSFEVPDKAAHTAKMVRLGLGRHDLSSYATDDLMPILSYLNSHFLHIDMGEVVPTAGNILARAQTIHRSTPLHALVVDPYMFIEPGYGSKVSETQAIKRILTQFQSWGRRNHVWVIVVAHPRKLSKVGGGNELERIDMYTIAGSANWANLADFILSISRIKQDENNEDGTPALDYTKVDVLKVRDQDMCSTGSVLYKRQPCGRYDERADKETIKREAYGHYQPRDEEVWCKG